ncbi:MAG TPA: nuclear transport factor 2 family protein [Steroidobacteraceae bacterium]|jgi:ketosteroid isomerase-like protein|nr:nuclear transport factor 2 family protein [Steroidobacteraceae bacterium]
MTNRETMLEVIRVAYAARGRGDLDSLMSAFHPTAVFTLVGDKRALDVVGSVQGHAGLREALSGYIANFEFVERNILSELVEGNRAVVHSRLVVRYKPKDKIWTSDVLDLFKFQSGKIVELIEFTDTAQIKDMMS